ncbi:MAG: 50S ribosome-binding GTPase [Candidatus Omnitrophica bacterium]|nr:50S ribosome-binding GTPase [Candidatus Omnitrophota bacterium]
MERTLDEVKIFVKAGDGGRGCDSRLRISEKKFLNTGGEGGSGGSVIVRADRNVTNLREFLYHPHFRAGSGGLGGSNHKRGKKGRDVVISVPSGTVVYRKDKSFLIRDLVEAGDEVIVLEGGRGGAGNAGGRFAQPGEAGGSLEIVLIFKIPADVFLIGLPNTGKSKLLNRLTHAHAREESFPFSTRHPELGTHETPDYRQVLLCELPALYRESHAGRGLGVDYLKHLDRGKIILFVLDPLNAFAGTLGEGYDILLETLGRYRPSLLEISRGVVVNKMDLEEVRERVGAEKFRPPDPLFLISAETGEGVEELMHFVTAHLRKMETPKELSHG